MADRARPAPKTSPARASSASDDPRTQLEAFIGKFSPADQRQIRAVRRVVRGWCPTAHELVWDNYNFFVIGYSPTERPSDAPLSIAARAGSIGICFVHGVGLPDPARLLDGSGVQTRFLHVESVAMLSRPEVKALVAHALARAKVAMPASGRGKLIIRSISAKQRPRRAAAKAARRR